MIGKNMRGSLTFRFQLDYEELAIKKNYIAFNSGKM